MNLVPRSSLFDIDTFFDNPWAGLTGTDVSRSGSFSPRVDVRDNEGNYEITAELPGVKKEDVNITLNNGVLSIQAESRQEDKEEKNGRVIRQERRYGKFVRSFDLGGQVQESDIKANFNDGILRLTVPKAQSAVEQPKRIQIQ